MIRKIGFGAAIMLGLAVLAVYLLNASWLAPRTGDDLYFISHRGVHQTYDREGLGPDECTAVRIDAIRHSFIENTIPSMQAAFEAGASIVEIDIHPTPDGEFAVFHDWTLECRTDGAGVTRETPMTEITRLDPGYGYTADQGRTYPLRGGGAVIPALSDVLSAFPDQVFLINFKSRDAQEADHLSAYLRDQGVSDMSRFLVYGGAGPTERFKALYPDTKGFTRGSVAACAKSYLALGWLGVVPASCRGTVIVIPHRFTRFAWGWPHRFAQRMREHDTQVWIMGDGPGATSGIDDRQTLNRLPRNSGFGVWTDRIETVNPNSLDAS